MWKVLRRGVSQDTIKQLILKVWSSGGCIIWFDLVLMQFLTFCLLSPPLWIMNKKSCRLLISLSDAWPLFSTIQAKQIWDTDYSIRFWRMFLEWWRVGGLVSSAAAWRRPPNVSLWPEQMFSRDEWDDAHALGATGPPFFLTFLFSFLKTNIISRYCGGELSISPHFPILTVHFLHICDVEDEEEFDGVVSCFFFMQKWETKPSGSVWNDSVAVSEIALCS